MTENESVADGDDEGAAGDATDADGDDESPVEDAAAVDGEEAVDGDGETSTVESDGAESEAADGDVEDVEGDGADADAAAADGTDEAAAGEAQAAGEAAEEAEDAVEAEETEAAEKTEEADEADEREELVEWVSETDPDELADEIADLHDEVESLEAERDDLESRLKRKQAEFQNYKKRQEKRREEERQRATEALVERLLDVRDNLQRALETDEDADIRGGVETTLRQFDRVLDAENVERIAPEPGDEVDPQRHEVLMRVESDREPGTVDELHRPGYEMAGKLLRAAQVTVAEEPAD